MCARFIWVISVYIVIFKKILTQEENKDEIVFGLYPIALVLFALLFPELFTHNPILIEISEYFIILCIPWLSSIVLRRGSF